MILYKYVGFEAGLKILETNSIGFSHLEDFNDPFECTGFGFYDVDVPIEVLINAFRNRFSRKYAILSLTRTPLNPLMWSHYADSYKGMVIGIDVEKAGLDNASKYIIPSTKGEIRYLKTIPLKANKANLDVMLSIGDSDKMNWEQQENILKHGLLYKMQEWAYEEEVRVVKNITKAQFSYYCDSNEKVILDNDVWTRVQLPTRPIYTLELPQNSIVSVTCGKNAYKELRRMQENSSQVVNHIVHRFDDLKRVCEVREIPLYGVKLSYKSWDLTHYSLPSLEN